MRNSNPTKTWGEPRRLRRASNSCRTINMCWTPLFARKHKWETDHLTCRGGYGFSEKQIRTTRELEYFFFCRAKREFFSLQNLTLGYMTKTLNQIFFSSTKITIFFSATLGIRIFFLEKNHTPPPFQVKWSVLKYLLYMYLFIIYIFDNTLTSGTISFRVMSGNLSFIFDRPIIYKTVKDIDNVKL